MTVIIPALNEAGNIRQLVQEIYATAPAVFSHDLPSKSRAPGISEAILRTKGVEVIVVDNGSTDSTAQEAREVGAKVVSEPRRGYGYACAAGVAEAGQADVLAFLDGDCSFAPSDLPSLLAPIHNGRADLVLGSRSLGHMAPGAMPPHQRFGNWLVARLMNTLYGLSITDLGPYRAIRRQLLIQLEMQEMTYGWPTEMIVKSVYRKARIVEVPVRYHNRRFGRSKVSGTVRGTVLATWFILGVTLRYAWRTH